MSLSALMSDIDDWCGTPVPGHPPRPHWLRDAMTAVVLAELSAHVASEKAKVGLYSTAADLYGEVADAVALNPQPLPPLSRPGVE